MTAQDRVEAAALDAANARAERWRLRYIEKRDAVHRVRTLIAETESDAKERRHLSRLSTSQVTAALDPS